MAAFLLRLLRDSASEGDPVKAGRAAIWCGCRQLVRAPRCVAAAPRGQLLTVAGTPDKPFVPCVGAVITRGDGRILLIRRGNEPGRGLWSLPGGHVEPGETDAAAVAREVLEETGLTVTVGELAGRVQRGRYDIADYFATVVGGELAAGTDALDARWADPRELDVTPGLVDALTSWGVTFGGG